MHSVPTHGSSIERGCEPSLSPAVVGAAVLRAPDGFVAETYAGLALEGPVTETRRLNELRMMKIGLSFEPTADDWSMRVSGTVVPGGDGDVPTRPRPGGVGPAPGQRRGRPGRFHQSPPSRRERLLRAGQSGPCRRRPFREGRAGRPGRGVRLQRHEPGRLPSGLPDSRRRRAAGASSARCRCGGRRHRLCRYLGRDGDGGTRPHHPGFAGTPGRVGPASRCGESLGPSWWSMLRHRSTWSGRTTLLPCCSAGSAARRWRRGWWTCSSALRSRAGVCRPRSRCGWSTRPRTRTFPVRTESCVTARACSWATAAMSTTRSLPDSRSATA